MAVGFTGVEHLDLDQQKTWEQRKPAERRRHKTRKMLGNIFHQIDGLMMIFSGRIFQIVMCLFHLYLHWIQWNQLRPWCCWSYLAAGKWKASNSGGKTGETNHQFLGCQKLLWQWQPWAWKCKKVACLFVVVRWVLVLFLWKNWLSFLEAMLACVLFIFSSGLFVVGSLRVAFFGAHPLGQQDLVGSPLFPAAPLAGCRRQVKLTPCPWGQPIGFCERKQIRWMTARRMG